MISRSDRASSNTNEVNGETRAEAKRNKRKRRRAVCARRGQINRAACRWMQTTFPRLRTIFPSPSLPAALAAAAPWDPDSFHCDENRPKIRHPKRLEKQLRIRRRQSCRIRARQKKIPAGKKKENENKNSEKKRIPGPLQASRSGWSVSLEFSE